MTTELAPPVTTPPARLAAKRPRLKALARQAMQSADQAAKLLPVLLARIEKRLPDMEDKQLVSAGHLLAGIAQTRAHVSKMAGLKNNEAGAASPTVVNVSINAGLPLEERIRLIQAEVSGVPLIGTQAQAPEILVKTAQVREVPPEAPDAAQPPSSAPERELRSPGTLGRSLDDRLADL